MGRAALEVSCAAETGGGGERIILFWFYVLRPKVSWVLGCSALNASPVNFNPILKNAAPKICI